MRIFKRFNRGGKIWAIGLVRRDFIDLKQCADFIKHPLNYLVSIPTTEYNINKVLLLIWRSGYELFDNSRVCEKMEYITETCIFVL